MGVFVLVSLKKMDYSFIMNLNQTQNEKLHFIKIFQKVKSFFTMFR